jgi:aspartyl-tRNA(Asn)/glutamyl-tRNA(Gln) amidotransferase subunit A
MGSSNETSANGVVVNPWRSKNSKKELVPGGSSGGSSAAVAASLCPVATATDTGGSIRQPAAFTGTVGLKPTYGRCSRWGIVAFASSLDQAGPITKTVKDSALTLQAMAGYDNKDSTSANIEVENFEDYVGSNLNGMSIGIPKEFEELDLSPDIRQNWEEAIQWYKEAGVNIKSINLPHCKYALPAYYIIAPAEASSNLARYDGVKYGKRVSGKDLDSLYKRTRGEGFGDEVKRRILMGTYVLSAGYYDAYYLKAQRVRRLIHEDFVQAFKTVDAILTPTTPTTAFGIGENISDPLKMYSNDILTVPVNLAGLPAISIPSGLDSSGLPMGIQLITNHFDEKSLFKFGRLIEESRVNIEMPTDWWIKK